MNKEKNTKKTPNFIENADLEARKLFGYDDDALLREFEEAEQELEQMKRQDPNLEQTLKQETDAGLEALMNRIHEAGLKPVTEKAYEEKEKRDNRKVISFKPLLKVMFVAAAVMVVLMGMGIGVSAGKNFEYRKIRVGDVKNKVRWDNDGFSQSPGELEAAYEEIYNKLGIDVLKLNYIPMDMLFEEVLIEKGHATLVFTYRGRNVYLKETKYVVDKVSDSVVSDRKHKDAIYNFQIEKELIIEENEVEEGFCEYSTSTDIEGAYYYLSGAIEIEEFKKIAAKLGFE